MGIYLYRGRDRPKLKRIQQNAHRMDFSFFYIIVRVFSPFLHSVITSLIVCGGVAMYKGHDSMMSREKVFFEKRFFSCANLSLKFKCRVKLRCVKEIRE